MPLGCRGERGRGGTQLIDVDERGGRHADDEAVRVLVSLSCVQRRLGDLPDPIGLLAPPHGHRAGQLRGQKRLGRHVTLPGLLQEGLPASELGEAPTGIEGACRQVEAEQLTAERVVCFEIRQATLGCLGGERIVGARQQQLAERLQRPGAARRITQPRQQVRETLERLRMPGRGLRLRELEQDLVAQRGGRRLVERAAQQTGGRRVLPARLRLARRRAQRLHRPGAAPRAREEQDGCRPPRGAHAHPPAARRRGDGVARGRGRSAPR